MVGCWHVFVLARTQVDSEKQTALFYARRGEVARALIRHGASPAARNNAGQVALVCLLDLLCACSAAIAPCLARSMMGSLTIVLFCLCGHFAGVCAVGGGGLGNRRGRSRAGFCCSLCLCRRRQAGSSWRSRRGSRGV